MKKLLTIACVIGTTILQPSIAQADSSDKALAAIGGFLGGVVATNIVNDHRESKAYYHRSNKSCRETKVIVRSGSYNRHRGDGHYEYRRVKVWNPGYWEFTRDACGRRVKVWNKGYYSFRREKVWVEHCERPRYRTTYTYSTGSSCRW